MTRALLSFPSLTKCVLVIGTSNIGNEIAELAGGEDVAHGWHGAHWLGAGFDVRNFQGRLGFVGQEDGEGIGGFLFQCPRN